MEVNGTKNNSNADYYIISKSVYQEMVEYCRQQQPFEACGLLSGSEGIGLTLWKLKNESQRLNYFFMSTDSIKLAVDKMEEQAEQLTGIFHSHPSAPAYPSSRDIKNNPYTELAYIIISFHKGIVEAGCFKTDGKKAIPLTLVICDV